MNSNSVKELLRTLNSLDMALLVIDEDLNIEFVNQSVNHMLSVDSHEFRPGDSFRKFLEVHRPKDASNEHDERWEDYVDRRLAELCAGNIAPYELERDGETSLIYSVSVLSENRRLVSYMMMNSDEFDAFSRNEDARLKESYTGELNTAVATMEDYIRQCDNILQPSNEPSDAHDGETSTPDRTSVEKETTSAFKVLDNAVQNMSDGFLIFENETVKYHNSRLLEIFGLSKDTNLIGKTATEAIRISLENLQVEDRTQALERVINSIRSNESYTIEQKMLDDRSLRITGTAQDDGLYLYTYSDITDLKAQQDELEKAKSDLERALEKNKRSEDRFRVFAEANSDWFWQTDSDLKYTYFSEKLFNVTGVRPENMLGKTRRELGMRNLDPQVYEDHLADLDTRRPFRDLTYSLKKPDGSSVWLAVSGVPVFDANGAFEGYVGAGRDVTEHAEKQFRLEEAIRDAETAERAKSEFLANMSHEIRTPMNGVMGMAELLAATELDGKQSMFTDVIIKSGASLLTIINDILDFSKLDAGQLELDSVPFNLAEAIEDVATLISAKVAEKDLELIVRVNPELPDIMIGDVGRLRQVMTNLVGNAVKFTEKGHVYVNVDGDCSDDGKAKLRFCVEDTGIGIPKQDCDAIFKKFSQVDTSATRKHEGTGLGLSIANSLVGLMGGKIEVESTIGLGTMFWFDIELDSLRTEQKKAQIVPGDMRGARVLIIDDNGVNRAILSEQMTAWNFDSAAASSGREGLKMVEAIISNGLGLDLIILDYQMPVMSGAEVLQYLRNSPVTRNIPVLMLTSVDSSQSNKELSALGVEGNLTKPARSSHLLETILQIVASNREKTAHQPAPTLVNTIEPLPPSTSATTSQIAEDPEANMPALDILVAEDNEVNQMVFSQILEETGLNFKITENGRLALAAYKARQPRMVLMDVSMPEMNGKEATEAIRFYEKANGKSRIPIIGVTAHALKGDMEACLDAGMDDYLSKPVSPAKLVRKVEQWLKVDLDFSEAG